METVSKVKVQIFVQTEKSALRKENAVSRVSKIFARECLALLT